jgi:mannitol/fructose-specific phosphotransferase system IIA component (Ntr-type)
LAVVIMRESRIEGYDPGFRSPLYPWIHVFGFLAPFWLIAEMGGMAVAFSLGLVAVTVVWYFAYAHDRVERTGAIFHTFARLGERRHGGLDLELRGIVKEKGLREEDPFDAVVARARVLDVEDPVSLEEIVDRAARHLSDRLGIPRDGVGQALMEEVRAGFVPLASGAALPHVRVPGLEHPELLLVRLRRGLAPADRDGTELAPGTHEGIRAVFFLVSPEDEPGQHLRLLGHLATHVDDPDFLDLWLEARSEDELRDTLLREERSLTVWVRKDRAAGEWIGRALRDIRLPDDTLVAMIRRSGSGLVPNGSSVIQEDDHLVIIGNPKPIASLASQFGRG